MFPAGYRTDFHKENLQRALIYEPTELARIRYLELMKEAEERRLIRKSHKQNAIPFQHLRLLFSNLVARLFAIHGRPAEPISSVSPFDPVNTDANARCCTGLTTTPRVS